MNSLLLMIVGISRGCYLKLKNNLPYREDK